MRKLIDIFASLFFLFLGVGAAIGGIRLHLGSVTEPQPGFFPFLAAIILAFLSLILLLQTWAKNRDETKVFGNLWAPSIIVIGLAVYVLIFNVVGFLIATVILSATVLWVLDTKPWWILTIVSLIFSIGSYILFDRLLGMQLPGGILARLF